jgi:hypothetical protein
MVSCRQPFGLKDGPKRDLDDGGIEVLSSPALRANVEHGEPECP